MLGALVRIIGPFMVGLVMFVPIFAFQGVADSGWVTRDMAPHLSWHCGSVVLGTGTILTARHCLNDDVTTYALILEQNRLAMAEATCRSSREADVATLDSNVQGSILTLRHPTDPIGESVVVAGYPAGEFVVTVGIVLGAQRNVFIPTTQTTIPLIYVISNPSGQRPQGFSGGPVFDVHRRLVGIICCGSRILGMLAMIPLEKQVAECPF